MDDKEVVRCDFDGAIIMVIQNVMGHADIRTTMEIYAEVSEKKKQDVFKNLNMNDII